METPKDSNNNQFIQTAKISIDECLNKKDFKYAFLLLIYTLEKLDDNEKVEFINYYNKKSNRLYCS
jgi:hypothetical protein